MRMRLSQPTLVLSPSPLGLGGLWVCGSSVPIGSSPLGLLVMLPDRAGLSDFEIRFVSAVGIAPNVNPALRAKQSAQRLSGQAVRIEFLGPLPNSLNHRSTSVPQVFKQLLDHCLPFRARRPHRFRETTHAFREALLTLTIQ